MRTSVRVASPAGTLVWPRSAKFAALGLNGAAGGGSVTFKVVSADRPHVYAACITTIPVTAASQTVAPTCSARSDALSAAIRRGVQLDVDLDWTPR